MAKEKTNRLAAQKASGQKLPARCECGGRLIYAYEFQRVWCYCDACTPVVNVNLSKSLTGVRRGS